MNIAILSNVNVDLLTKKFTTGMAVFSPAGYGVWIQELLNESSQLYHFEPTLVFVLLDARELFGIEPSVEECLTEIQRLQVYFEQILQNKPHIKFFISDLDYPERNISPYGVRSVASQAELAWNTMLVQLSQKYSNLYVFRLKELVCQVGREKFYSPKLWYLGGIKYSGTGDSLIAGKIEQIASIKNGARKKCLLLDLDNTLWGGVVGELGPKGIELSDFKEGARFKDFQQKIKEIKETGIILGLVSKNNWTDVCEVFEQHKSMVLHENDFAVIKVNWQDKVDNIQSIAQELNIGLDSIVFVDDNPVERDAIKQLLPEVSVPDFPQDTTQLENFGVKLWEDYFFALELSEEDRSKTVLYQQNHQRAEALKHAVDMGDYLQSLATVISIWPVRVEDVERVSQLTQKTNQFNLTTKRYLEEELIYFLKSPAYSVYVVSVKDCYGDSGKVAVLVLKKEADKVKLENFVMSCRVMGRRIEDQLLDYIEQQMKQAGFSQLITYYYPTTKNKPVEGLFDRLGYELIDQDEAGNKTYVLDLKNCPERVHYARLVES
ncbi:FkbH-like protein [Sporomusaceae bacterium BoRhaA]|uniref:HAD-IIIC family phosphatase n=1 Tax=Pelorhabdus rhamnosifermentans TaxID=2772457 RepID=UPI001C0619F3|nr:HAD-IIIC family phosphatase [Pelorhabdus rhamnosifermentans]MBU2699194.1 FkbH-like protein [Pelorhabdus rhamnosifermentans]